MSASVASKNLYELLGNDPPEDDTPKPLPREVVKPTTSSRKRDEKFTPNSSETTQHRGSRGGRRFGGNEGAFRDSEAGRESNRSKNTNETGEYTRGSGRGRGRGGRREYDRRSQTGRTDTEKKIEQGWGAKVDGWEEQTALEVVQQETTGESQDFVAPGIEDVPAEPQPEAEAEAEAAAEREEERQKTYDEYLAERAQRAIELGPPSEIRRPNEGSRQDKKWAAAKELSRKEEEEDAYFVGESKEKTRNRERKTKQLLEIEPRYVEPRENRRGGDRGGRGRGGGGRGPRGGRGGERRGDYQSRGGDNSASADVLLMDESAFPSLGA